MVQQEKYNIILIEPSPVIQQGIKAFLAENSHFHIQHIFPDYHSYENTPIRNTYQVVILNPSVVSVHKQFSVRNLFVKHPELILIALTYNYVDIETLSGFDGVLDIYSTETQFLRKLLKVIETHEAQNHTKFSTDSVDLSDREKEILVSVAVGLTNKEIADKHNISVHTVISHRKNISRKIGIKTVSGLTIYAIFNNLISDEDLK